MFVVAILYPNPSSTAFLHRGKLTTRGQATRFATRASAQRAGWAYIRASKSLLTFSVQPA